MFKFSLSVFVFSYLFPMNFLQHYFRVSQFFPKSIQCSVKSSLTPLEYVFNNSILFRPKTTLNQLRRRFNSSRVRPVTNPLGYDVPFAKGVVLKTLIKKPKKPNSANRKCVLVRLSNGKEMVTHVPGEGHNLQEHNVVLVRPGRTKDVPGLKLKCVRGKYDLSHVIKSSAK